MKRFLALALLFLLTVVTIGADSVRAPRGFAGKMYAGTLALYGTLGDKTHFLCTTEPYEKIAGGYHLLTAGHCIQTNPIDVKYSVAEYIGGPLVPVTIEKASFGEGFDFAILGLKTTKRYPVFFLGDEHDMRIGDRIIDPNFSEGLVKQLTYGTIGADILPNSQACTPADCAGDFLVYMDAGPGGSGSAIISLKTQQVVGVLVWEFGGQMGFGVEPISKFYKFLHAPNQPHPADEESI